jgi:hypothetical protein
VKWDARVPIRPAGCPEAPAGPFPFLTEYPMRHEQLTHAENVEHLQDAVGFILRLYGERGAELIQQGYRCQAADGVDLWTNERKDRADALPWMVLVCQHCGHELRDSAAMRRHLQNKHPRPAAA